MPTFCYHHISGVKVIATGKVHAEEQVFLCSLANEIDFLKFLKNQKMKYCDFGFEIMLEDNRSSHKDSAISAGVVLKSKFRNFGEVEDLKIVSKTVSEEIFSKSYLFDSEDSYNKFSSSEESVKAYSQVQLFSDTDRYFVRRV